MANFTVYEPNNGNEVVRKSLAKIKVIGVGGGGNNAVSEMWNVKAMDGVELIVANTDLDFLNASPVVHKIQIGEETTKGQGAGSDENVGRMAAEENADKIKQALQGADIVFISAGMGGGTGTGASPVVARIARELGILTVAIVTKPFKNEGRQRARIAERGIEALRDEVDSLIVIPNDKINENNPTALMKDAFKTVNMVLVDSVKSLVDIICDVALINTDLNDVRSLMRKRGTAMICYAEASGEDRAVSATQLAMSSPLLENINLSTAQGILIHVSGSSSTLTTEEYNAVQEEIYSVVPDDNSEDSEVFMKVGLNMNDALGDKLRVIIFATGMDDGKNEEKQSLGVSVSAPPLQPPPAFGSYGAIPPAPSLLPPQPEPSQPEEKKGGFFGFFK